MTTLRGLPSLGRLGWALIGGMIVLIAALSVWPEPIPYSSMIVPASAIRAREMPFTAPGPWDLGTRIRYVYVDAYVRAVAPGAVVEDVARFCRPTILAIADTLRVAQHESSPSLLRTVSWAPGILPISMGSLLVTSMDGYGDLVAEDYSIRAPFSVAAGLEEPYRTVVRYPRWAAPVDYARGALEIYGAVRFFLDVVVR